MSSMVSPTLRRSLLAPSRILPEAWSACPSARRRSSSVAAPIDSLTRPFACSNLPFISPEFGNPIAPPCSLGAFAPESYCLALNNPAPGKQLEDQHHDGQNQKQV